jgi:hypothetical protein
MPFSPYYFYRVFARFLAWGVRNHQGAAEKNRRKKTTHVRTLNLAWIFFRRATSSFESPYREALNQRNKTSREKKCK